MQQNRIDRKYDNKIDLICYNGLEERLKGKDPMIGGGMIYELLVHLCT